MKSVILLTQTDGHFQLLAARIVEKSSDFNNRLLAQPLYRSGVAGAETCSPKTFTEPGEASPASDVTRDGNAEFAK
jgi:hypothetical protein